MLMRGSGAPARVHYMAGTFRLLSAGDHVVCAVTGKRIPLDELRYGVSITDACLGWEATEALLREDQS